MSEHYEIVCRAADDPEQWRALRNEGIGASEAAILLGISPWKSGYQLYAEKIGAIAPPDLSDSEVVYWGTKLESIVIEVYAERSGRYVDKGGLLLRSTRYPWALATLDAWTAVAELGPYHPLEVKTAGAQKGEEWADGPPDIYRAQVAWQMLVTGTERATIACLIGGQRLVWCDIERDDVLERRLIHHGEEFWQRVIERNAPAPDGSEGTRRALHELYPRDTGETIALPAVLLDVVEELDTLKSREKVVLERKRELENLLKAALGDAATGHLPDGTLVQWQTVERRAYQVQASTSRVLKIKPPKRIAKGA